MVGWWDVWVVVFIVGRLLWFLLGFLLEDGHLVDKVLEFLVDDVSDLRYIVGRVAGTGLVRTVQNYREKYESIVET